ncbi:MAG: hypothetical protein WCF37_17950, partial [Pseudolabrys sp.]
VGKQIKIGLRNGRQQRAKFAASRAIAGNDVADFGLRFVTDFSALAAPGVGLFHCSPASFVGPCHQS